MFFCIVGVLVTVASDSVFTYHVAVSKSLLHMLAASLAYSMLDCRFPGCWPCLYNILGKLLGLLV